MGYGRRMARLHPIAVAREKALMTRQELADKAGLSMRTIWAAEQGYPLRTISKRRIMDALGLPREEHERYFGPVGDPT